ncbi:MAG: hypothetical protein ACK53X_08130 [Holosporales bacterium]
METVILLKRLVKNPYLEHSWKLEGAYLLVSRKDINLLKSFDGQINPKEFPDFLDIIQLVMDQTEFVFVPALGISLEINKKKTEVVWNIQLLLKIDGMKIKTVETFLI